MFPLTSNLTLRFPFSAHATGKQLIESVADLMPEIQKTVPLPGELISPLTTSAELEILAEGFRQQHISGPSSPPGAFATELSSSSSPSSSIAASATAGSVATSAA